MESEMAHLFNILPFWQKVAQKKIECYFSRSPISFFVVLLELSDQHNVVLVSIKFE